MASAGPPFLAVYTAWGIASRSMSSSRGQIRTRLHWQWQAQGALTTFTLRDGRMSYRKACASLHGVAPPDASQLDMQCAGLAGLLQWLKWASTAERQGADP